MPPEIGAHALGLEARGQGLGVGDDLAGVALVVRRRRLGQRDGLAGHRVHERPALQEREDGLVQGLRVLRLRDEHAAARAAQDLVRREGDDVGVRHRAGDGLAGDEPDEVRGVDPELRADLVGDLAELREVDEARVGGGAGDDHLRPVLEREVAHLVVVDAAVVLADGVGHRLEPLAREADLGAVREVPAVRQGHRQHLVAGLAERRVHREVGVGAGVRLEVGVLGAEERLGALDADLLGAVDDLAATVVTAAGVALGVLVRQRRAQGREHGRAGEVLAGDELQSAAQPGELVVDDLGDLGVDGPQGVVVRSPEVLRVGCHDASRYRPFTGARPAPGTWVTSPREPKFAHRETGVPMTSETWSAVTAPSRRRRGTSPVRSTIVEATPVAHTPPSR